VIPMIGNVLAPPNAVWFCADDGAPGLAAAGAPALHSADGRVRLYFSLINKQDDRA